jgi:hypothetical protein
LAAWRHELPQTILNAVKEVVERATESIEEKVKNQIMSDLSESIPELLKNHPRLKQLDILHTDLQGGNDNYCCSQNTSKFNTTTQGNRAAPLLDECNITAAFTQPPIKPTMDEMDQSLVFIDPSNVQPSPSHTQSTFHSTYLEEPTSVGGMTVVIDGLDMNKQEYLCSENWLNIIQHVPEDADPDVYFGSFPYVSETYQKSLIESLDISLSKPMPDDIIGQSLESEFGEQEQAQNRDTMSF